MASADSSWGTSSPTVSGLENRPCSQVLEARDRIPAERPVSVSRRQAFGLAAGVSSAALVLARGGDDPRAADAIDQAPAGLRLGVIGCGGRGTMAAIGVLEAAPGARVVAMADRSSPSIEASTGLLRRRAPGACDESLRFVGESAWQGVFDAGPDIVILATPANERPAQIQRAVAQGVALFCERPAAASLDAVEALRPAAAEADRRGLAVVTGLTLRRDAMLRAAVDGTVCPSGAPAGRQAFVPWRSPGCLRIAYPVPDRARAGVARWTAEQLVIDAIDVALWATGDQRVDRVVVARSDQAAPGPEATLACADGRVVRLVPLRRSAHGSAAGCLVAEAADASHLIRSHQALIAAATGRDGQAGPPRGELDRLLEATRLAILVARAAAEFG
jgi:hypothetical protein